MQGCFKKKTVVEFVQRFQQGSLLFSVMPAEQWFAVFGKVVFWEGDGERERGRVPGVAETQPWPWMG